MIAVDTNILVYAHRADSNFHRSAYAALAQLAEDILPWAIPWPCLHEFISIVTHPKIYRPPSRMEDAIIQVECWLESPSIVLLAETNDYWDYLKSTLQTAKIEGPKVHDAKIAAICIQNEISELWSCDRDFSRFPKLKTHNPLINKVG